MCGRFNVDSGGLTRYLLALVGMPYSGPDNFNASPTQSFPVLRHDAERDVQLVPMRWWLIPYFSKEPKTKYSTFNARAESAPKSPLFREPIRKRRCALPISGFYEWAKTEGGKQPYYIRPREAEGILLACVWDRWRNPDADETLDSFAILTTDVSEGLRFVHNRQPVILDPDELHQWLDPEMGLEEVAPMFAPRMPIPMEAVPVSPYVSNSRNTGPQCTEPVGDPVAISTSDS